MLVFSNRHFRKLRKCLLVSRQVLFERICHHPHKPPVCRLSRQGNAQMPVGLPNPAVVRLWGSGAGLDGMVMSLILKIKYHFLFLTRSVAYAAGLFLFVHNPQMKTVCKQLYFIPYKSKKDVQQEMRGLNHEKIVNYSFFGCNFPKKCAIRDEGVSSLSPHKRPTTPERRWCAQVPAEPAQSPHAGFVRHTGARPPHHERM